MDENDPRRELDQFTAFLVETFREEIEITIKSLMSANSAVANAQIEILHQRTVERIKKWDFELWSDVAALTPSALPEKDVLKVYGIFFAALEQTITSVREHIADCHEAIYGGEDDDEIGSDDGRPEA